MAIYYNRKSRRQFLIGSGKSMLALPLLPSLLPRKSWAQSTPPPRRMMIFHFDHNNLAAMWPNPINANTNIGNDGSREVMLRTLGSMASHSRALNNPRYEALMNSDLITMVRGFDILGSSGSAHGNFGVTAGQGRQSEPNFPSIDTVIEASQSVYPSSTPLGVRRALRIGGDWYQFFRKVGNNVQHIPAYYNRDLRNFYNEVFGSLTNGTVPPQDLTNQLKSNILNRVHQTFGSFRNGAKISSDDRARLDQHMDLLSDLQRGLASDTPSPITCSRPQDPGNLDHNTQQGRINQTYMDLSAVAFMCGLTKFGVMSFEGEDPQWIPGLGTQGNGVHGIMHGQYGADLQLAVKTRWWRYFSNMISDRFLAPLEAMEGDTGRSYLDNMITVLMCQGGFANPGGDGGHSGLDSNQVLIGSMAGRLRAGRFMTMPRSQTGNIPGRGGNLPYNCFLLTLLNLMGVPPNEYAFATANGQGFGNYSNFGGNYDRVRQRFYQPVNELLA